MHDKIQRFSLRKLSVGLASVAIGTCIFSANAETAKADVTSDQTTQTTNVKGQTATTQPQNEKTQTSSAQNSVAEQSQKNLLDDLGKQKASTQSGDQAEAKNQENRLVDQINYKLTDNTSTDNNQDLGQNKVAPDETKQAPTDKNDAEKSIVSSSSAQKINNQSNNHAEDNSQIQPQNSQRLNKKVLATNLTETQPQQDISKVTDPSKIDASHFADGTRWTPAGWTRADKNTKVAKSSKLDIEWNNGSATDKPTAWVNQSNIKPRFKDITFTIDKDDLRQGNNILIGTIQSMPTNGDKQFADYIKSPALSVYSSNAMDAQIQFNNQNIGYLYVKQNDASEIDIYLGVNKTFSNLAIDPSFKFNVLANSNYSDFLSYKNHLKYPLDYSLVSNSNILDYQINANTHLVNENSNPNFSSDWIYNDPTWQFAGKGFTRVSNQFNPSNSQTGFVYKIITLQGDKPNLTKSGVNINYDINLVNANGKQTDANVNIGYKHISFKKATDNLTSADLWNATQDGSAMFSNQPDGSLLVCIKPGFLPIDKNKIKNATSTSYLANIQDPEHAQQIIDNTVNMTKSWSYMIANFGLAIPTANQTHQVIDVTPSNVGEVNIGTSTIGSNTHGGHSDTDIETYKHVKISYVDDDDNSKSVSSDSMTGRQNKASTYTVNIPKGYYLDDNNTSTGYTWNADHTDISYTFNKDQAKNDANPIEIHLKHKHTAVTDSSQLQTTGKRTITITLPHQDKPMIIVQTVGYKRTGTYDEVVEASKGLDEAEKEGNYTDWVFDADTSNVTVDGQPSTQYQAYILKDGVVNYAPIKLPHINGYKAKLIQDKANPAMFMVSFVALPQQNNQSTSNEPQRPSDNVQSSQKEAQTKQKQPEPIQNQPAEKQEDKEVAQILNHIAFELMHDTSSNADSFEPAQNDSDSFEAPSDSTQKDDAAKPQKVNAVKHKKHIAKKRVVKRHKKHAKKYHLKRRSRKHSKHSKRAKKRIIKHRKSVSRKFRKHNLKHVKKN